VPISQPTAHHVHRLGLLSWNFFARKANLGRNVRICAVKIEKFAKNCTKTLLQWNKDTFLHWRHAFTPKYFQMHQQSLDDHSYCKRETALTKLKNYKSVLILVARLASSPMTPDQLVRTRVWCVLFTEREMGVPWLPVLILNTDDSAKCSNNVPPRGLRQHGLMRNDPVPVMSRIAKHTKGGIQFTRPDTYITFNYSPAPESIHSNLSC
jgi:hypothetical protein